MPLVPATPRTSALSDSTLVDIATRYGTPTYVYDLDAMIAGARAIDAAFADHPHLVAYAVKANAAGPVLRAFASLGLGADVVTGPELRLARASGIDARRIVFSGVAKSDAELRLAIEEDILAVQVESTGELERLGALAAAVGRVARVSIRVNPGLDDLDTHAHVRTGHDEAKFGIALRRLDVATELVRATPSLQLVGLACHVGSQFATTREYLEGARIVMDLAARLTASMPLEHSRAERGDATARGASSRLEFVDAGGGFGIDYGGRPCEAPADFVRAALAEKALRPELAGVALHVEPGRCLVGAHGVLVAKVIGEKSDGEGRRWLLIDAGMNDLMRPALYQAEHRIEDVGVVAPGRARYRVVGPICESSDDFGERELADPPAAHVVLRDVGAYGYSMASRYNGRAIAAEVFVAGGKVIAVAEREPDEAWVASRLAFSAPG